MNVSALLITLVVVGIAYQFIRNERQKKKAAEAFKQTYCHACGCVVLYGDCMEIACGLLFPQAHDPYLIIRACPSCANRAALEGKE